MTANRIFDRVVIPVRQRPLSTDHNRMFGTLQEQQRRLALLEYGQRQSTAVLDGGLGSATLVDFQTGFTATGFRVEPAVGMSVAVKGGPDCYGWSEADVTSEVDFGGNLGVEIGPLAPSPLVLTVTQDLVVPAAPAPGSSRIDIIEVRPEATLADTLPMSIWDVILRRFTTQNVPKTLTWDLDGLTGSVVSPAASTAAISYKKGIEAVGAIGAATEPTGTTGYTTIARINVVGGTTAITAAMIADRRALLQPQGLMRVSLNVLIGRTISLITEEIRGVQAPPGIWCRMVAVSNTAGSSCSYALYIFGVQAPSSAYRALLTGHSPTTGGGITQLILVSATTGTLETVDATLRATLNSAASIGGAVDVAEGTKCLKLTVIATATTQNTADLPAAGLGLTLHVDIAQAI